MKSILTNALLTIFFISSALLSRAACELYSLDLADTSTFSVNCGTVAGTNWKTVNGDSCHLTTPIISLPGDSGVDGNIDIPYSVKIHPAGNCNGDDRARMEYSVNGGIWTQHWVIAASAISGATIVYDTVPNLSAGGSMRFRLTYAANTSCTNWKLFTGDLCVSWPLSTGTGLDFSSVLPIELSSFKGMQVQKTNKIDWSTDTETENDYFTLQRSENGLNFENIGMIDGAGNSATRRSYTELDEYPTLENNYYRLIQTDFDLNSTTSETIAVYYTEETDDNSNCDIEIYPNPCLGKCNVDFNECKDSEFKVAIYDAAGNTVYQTLSLPSEGPSFIIDSKNNLMPGVYIVVGNTEDQTINKKIIVQ